MSTTIAQLRERAKGILEIPANEQCIGHFQVAITEILDQLFDHIEKLEKLVGVERA
jgi:hypothetical protein